MIKVVGLDAPLSLGYPEPVTEFFVSVCRFRTDAKYPHANATLFARSLLSQRNSFTTREGADCHPGKVKMNDGNLFHLKP